MQVIAAGAQKVWRGDIGYRSYAVHLLGTCRMGNDPATSVVDNPATWVVLNACQVVA